MLIFILQWIFLFNYINLVRSNSISESNLGDFKSNQTDRLRFSSRSKGKSNQDRWKDFDCETISIEPNSLHWVFYDRKYLYFYFTSKLYDVSHVVRMEIPDFIFTHNDTEALHLIYRYPLKVQGYDFLTKDHVIPGLKAIKVGQADEYYINDEGDTYLFEVPKPYEFDSMSVKKVDFQTGSIGELTHELKHESELKSKLSQFRMLFFTREDHLKYFEIFYDSYGVTFKTHESPTRIENIIWGLGTVFLDYKVKYAVYYQNDYIASTSKFWTGVLVEVDDQHRIRFNRFVFRVDTFTKTQIKISSHYHYVDSVTHFFDCLPSRIFDFDKNDVKGFLTIANSTVSYLSINSYWIEIDYDMVSEHFVFDKNTKEKRTRISKLSIEDIYIDKISMKYIKQIGNQNYFTGINLTYEIQFREKDSKKLLHFRKETIKLHECKYQTFHTLTNHSFCFDKQTYYFISKDNFKSTAVFPFKYYISDLFKPLDYGGEDIELIFNYKNNQVVFMTENYLLIFSKELFVTEQTVNRVTMNEPETEDYLLKLKKYAYAERKHTLTHNCLFNQSKCLNVKKERRSVDSETDKWMILNCILFIVNLLIILYFILNFESKKKLDETSTQKELNEISTQKELDETSTQKELSKQTVKSIQTELKSIKTTGTQSIKSTELLSVLNKKFNSPKLSKKLNSTSKKKKKPDKY